jgi:outer membrane protein
MVRVDSLPFAPERNLKNPVHSGGKKMLECKLLSKCAIFCAGLLFCPALAQAENGLPANTPLSGDRPVAEAQGSAPSPVASDLLPAPVLSPGENLTLRQAVEIARRLQPEILAAQGGVMAGEGRVGQARSDYFPRIDGLAGYSRVSPAVGADANGSFNQYSAGIAANQLIYDFGRTSSRIAVQKSNLDSFRADMAAVDDQVIFNVILAYYDMLRAARNREVAEENVRQFDRHLTQATGFFQAGLRPRYDVTKAEVDLSNARLNLIRAENGLRLARVVLNNAMGLPDAPAYEVEDILGFRQFGLPLETALTVAAEKRPDLQALVLRRRAAEQALVLAGKGNYPFIAANATAYYAGEEMGDLKDGWDAGVALSIPIFNGHQTRYQAQEARANLTILAAHERSLRQAIYRDVHLGYLNLQEAEERVHTGELIVRQAEENYEIAAGRYNAGVGNPVEVADAEVILVNARISHIQALYDYRLAQTDIERAIGMLRQHYGD